jgi:hypothetical protein
MFARAAKHQAIVAVTQLSNIFTQTERFAGLLVGLSRGTLAKTRDGFEQMDLALKQRAEAAVA